MKFRTRFNVEEFENVGLVCDTPTMTQQHFKDECDINSIINRYKVTGVLGDPLDVRQPMYADVSEIPDLMAAQNLVIEANERFMELPSDVRKRFDNNPAVMLEFLQNPDNREEGVKLGLLEPKFSRVDNSPAVDIVQPVSKPVTAEKDLETNQK